MINISLYNVDSICIENAFYDFMVIKNLEAAALQPVQLTRNVSFKTIHAAT